MTMEHLGILPSFLWTTDLRPAAEQINERYQHGGGWNPMEGWKVDRVTGVAQYPEDPLLQPLAVAMLGAERLYFYDGSWLCIMQPDGSFEVGRVD